MMRDTIILSSSPDMVSVIMLSHNSAKYVEESVRSVINQTYKNWVLLFIDDSSHDDTIQKVMQLKTEGRQKDEDGWWEDRIKVYQTVTERGVTYNINSALKEAHGKWIAFLNVGDVWTPEKLERQVMFMKTHEYSFSYHQYRLMDSESMDRGVLVSGMEHMTHRDFLKCCWPAYLTVMYDAEKIGKMKVQAPQNNDYALWLNVSDKCDCYLLKEDLASMRTKWGRLGQLFLTNGIKWRYDAYRVDEDLNPIVAFFYTIRNGWYGIVKWMRFVKRQGQIPEI